MTPTTPTDTERLDFVLRHLNAGNLRFLETQTGINQPHDRNSVDAAMRVEEEADRINRQMRRNELRSQLLKIQAELDRLS